MIKEQKIAERKAHQSQTAEERAANIEELMNKAIERGVNSVSPYIQMTMGANPLDIVCPAEQELVIRISDGMPSCMSYDTATILVDRGTVNYPE